jgi:hypothetical protein
MESQPPGVFIKLQESPDEYVDVGAASVKRPTAVRDALLRAIRFVQLRPNDLKLLRLEVELQAAFSSPWKKPTILQPVLESCRQGLVTERTEILFYEYGGDLTIAILGIATRVDHGLRTKHDGRGLLREIDTLSDEEKTELVKNLVQSTQESVKSDVDLILQSFSKSPLGTVLALISPTS